MEPQLLIASLYEQSPARTAGQHDIVPSPIAEGAHGGVNFDTAGVIIALMAMIGIMIAMAMIGGDPDVPQTAPSIPRLLMSVR